MINGEHHINDDKLAAYLLNEGGDEVTRQVEEWIIESAENRKYFENFRTVWEASQALALPAYVNENDAWEKFKTRIVANEPAVAKVHKMPAFAARMAIAATILICAGLLVFGYLLWNKTNLSPITVAANSTATTKILPDGSEIILNKNSTITYTKKMQGSTRKITLNGEAFFKVTPDKNKPFVVNVNDVVVTVLGTSFNINSDAEKTEVIVESGVVSVEANNYLRTLKAGEKILITGADSVLKVQQSTDKLYNYYVTRQFVCDNTPLWKLVDVLNEAYEAQIVIENAKIRGLLLTTTFTNEPLDKILEVISETLDITVEQKNNRIILK